MTNKLTGPEKSWILYDVANSAFTMLVSTTIPILFRNLAESSGVDPAQATGLWGLVTSAAMLILAVLAPILGAVADYRGMKKKLFLAALSIGLLGLLGLAVTESWLLYLLFFVVARLGYSACNVFYDSMLTDVTTDERMDRISSQGYAWGYIGSCIPFVAGILLIFTLPFGLTTLRATQLSFLITGIWWVLLTLPLLKNVRQLHCLEDRQDKLSHAFRRIGETLKKVKQDKKLLYFILAYFCYIDGVYTIISMATTYGGEVGIGQTDMILALLLTQFVAFPCAILTGTLAGKIGSLRLIKFFIVVYCFACILGFRMSQAWEFWLLAIIVGMAQGGIQSLSRAYFGKLVPKEESNEYFGFFDIFGKFADFFGPLIVSFCAFTFGSSRIGVLALILLFIIGFILLSKIPKEE